MQAGRLQQAQVGRGSALVEHMALYRTERMQTEWSSYKEGECKNKEMENLFWLTACKTRHARPGNLDWPNKP